MQILPLCVAHCLQQIYYVVHNLPSIIKAIIHFGVHKHLVANGKCREYVDKTRRLTAKEVDYMHDVKIFAILLGANKTFLAMHLLDDSGDGTIELLNDECEELLHTFTTEICTHNKNPFASGTTM